MSLYIWQETESGVLDLRLIRTIWDVIKVVVFLTAIAWAIKFINHHGKTEISGNVRIVDGDSVRLNGEEIRLFGIDAPEYNQMCEGLEGGEPYRCGRRARDFLSQMVLNKKVVCAGSERDKYDRLLAWCSIGEKDINREMVLAGWAVSFGSYLSAENEAREAKRGVWVEDFQSPSQWRRDKREAHKNGFLSSLFNW